MVMTRSKRRRLERRCRNIMDLPREVVMDILSRLPLNSIMQLLEVFPDILSSAEFERLYSESHPRTFLGFNTATKEEEIVEYRHGSCHGDDQITASTRLNLIGLISEHEKPISKNFDIVGSCNGLILGHAMHKRGGVLSESLCLVNPLTRHCDILTCNELTKYPMIKYGLGYGSSTMLYKVVCLDSLGMDVMKVLTVDHSSRWKTADSYQKRVACDKIRHWIRYLEGPVALNGAIHWLVGTMNLILRFDVDDEEIDVVGMPYKQRSEYVMSQLSVVGGSLCALANQIRWNNGSQVEVWMNEYGGDGCWIRLAVLLIPEFDYSMAGINVMHVFEDGKLLIKLNSELHVYDPVQGKWEEKAERVTMDKATYFRPTFSYLRPVLS